MAIAEDELHAPLAHQVLAGTRMIGHRLDRSRPQPSFQRAEPAREERDRQRVGDSEAQARSRLVLREPGLDPRRLEAREHIPHERQESLARAGELDRMRTAVDKVDPDPLLERAYVSAERRLRDGARLRRPRKVAAFRQRHEILEPFDVERAVVWTHRRALNNCMQF
jgi:hypothetical protein